jgi:methylated-DNA-[protein]-cysteine S-methyltransferase
MKKPTDFQMRVYEVVKSIPCAQAATYGWVAARVGCRSARAVGGALRANPFAPEVPCHRVVAGDGSPGGFHGRTTGPRIAEKRRLLAAEGVTFDAAGRVAPDSLIR